MHPWLLLLLPLRVLANKERLRGVSPDLVGRYAPTKQGSAETWQCLDGSKSIDWSAINDDFCDCPDGSDEPGTLSVLLVISSCQLCVCRDQRMPKRLVLLCQCWLHRVLYTEHSSE